MTSVPLIAEQRNLIIACIEDHPKAIMMFRLARKRAQERNCRWRAVFIETPMHFRHAEEGAHERMLQLLTLAEQMGGEVAHIEAETMEKGLAGLVEREGKRLALVILAGAESEGSRVSLLRGASRKRIIRLLHEYTQVEFVPFATSHYHRSLRERLRLQNVRPMHVAYALGAVVIAYLCAYGLKAALPPALFRVNDQNVGLLFMIACAFVAGRYGLLPGLIASVASFFTVNYFFTVPYYVLKLDTVTDALNMGLFMMAAVLISLFTSQTRDYAQQAAKREVSTQALFTLYRIASDAFSRQQVLEKLHRKLERMLEVDVAFFLPPVAGAERVEAVFPTEVSLQEAERMALDVCWNEMKTTGAASPYNPGSVWRFEPMISPMGEIGVLGVRPRVKTRLDAWFGRLLTAIADQTATILEHIDLERSMEEGRIREEREQLRSMLLSSVSHDFKTPLAGIIGALSVYRSMGAKLSAEKRAELIEAAMEEAQRLDSFITNILDMTRLESGVIRFRNEWHDVKSMIWNVTKRMQHRLRLHDVVIHPCPPDIEAHMDVMMTEQVLQNVLDNACKYTPAGTRIEINCMTDDVKKVLCIQVRDYGAGLPPEKMSRVFDKYARLHKKDSQIAGTGLGLAISKAVMEMQGGHITASNHPDGGAVFSLYLPEWRRAESVSPLEARA